MWRRKEIEFVLESRLSEGAIATMRIETPVGSLLVMGEPQQDLAGRTLLVVGVHTNGEVRSGLLANAVGAANLQVIGQAFLEAFDYDELVLEGAIRTSGKRKGKRPRAIRFTRRPEPAA
jgi:hypothetical protein